MGILEVLTIVFVVLKLIGITAVATWSWWLVLSPLFLAISFYAVVVLLWVAVKMKGF